MQDLLQRGKHSNKRESQVKEERVHPEAQILRKLKGNEGVKNDQGEKGKKKSSSSSNILSSDSAMDSDSEAPVTEKRFR